MTPPDEQPLNPMDDRRKRRVTALSILRACKRAEATDRPQTAKYFGKALRVYPIDVPNLRDEYTPWLGNPRYRKSQSKKAVYQRMYRKRQKAKQSPSEDPEFYECCRAAGVLPWSPEGVAIDIAMRHLRTRKVEREQQPEALSERVQYDPVLGIERPPLAPLKQERKKRGPYKKRNTPGPLKPGNARRALFLSDGPSHAFEQPEKEWPLENEQPKTKTPTLENHAPEGTTLLQPYFEYAP